MTAGVAVVAIGGNSLVADEAHPQTDVEPRALGETGARVADLIGDGWRVVVTHGNGPQVGYNLLRAELAGDAAPSMSLDVLGAQTQGSIGYLLQQALGREFSRRGMPRLAATVVTQVVVDPRDPAFARPTKPVGRFYAKAEADALAHDRGWQMVEDAGRGWRRVVPSPRPLEIVELPVIRSLVETGVTVIAAGGGGIPVVRRDDGGLEGVEAVIDKDLASAVLASSLCADALVISTAVSQVALYYGTPRARPLAHLTASQARRYLDEGHFPPGSMGPKIRAALQFLAAGGGTVIVTSPDRLGRAVRGEGGTRITADGHTGGMRHA